MSKYKYYLVTVDGVQIHRLHRIGPDLTCFFYNERVCRWEHAGRISEEDTLLDVYNSGYSSKVTVDNLTRMKAGRYIKSHLMLKELEK